jgi:carbon-monoxide dehydrogenase small subunit
MVPMMQCRERKVETVEGLAGGEAKEFLDRFVESGGVQCGACTPGVVVTAWALLRRRQRPDPEEIRRALAGNLCRCTGYEGILRSFARQEGEG